MMRFFNFLSIKFHKRILDSLPCIVTVIEMNPKTQQIKSILFQNKASISYYGDPWISSESRAILELIATTLTNDSTYGDSSRDSKSSIASRKMSHIRKSIIKVSNGVWHQITRHALNTNVFVIHQNDMTELVMHTDMLQHTLADMLPDHVIGTLRMSYASRNASRDALRDISRDKIRSESKDDDINHERLRILELNTTTANAHDNVTIMFCDIVGFTSMADTVSPIKVMQFINEIFSMIDCLTKRFKVHKVETAGDCYIAVSGVVEPDRNKLVTSSDAAQDASKMFEFAKAVIKCIKNVRMPDSGEKTSIRIGLHSGPVVSGLVGNTIPKFGLFGDTMNVAARMEQTAPVQTIQMSETTYRLCESFEKEGFEGFGSFGFGIEHFQGAECFQKTSIHVKGKPDAMTTYIWRPRKNRNKSTSQNGSSSEIDLDVFMKKSLNMFNSQT